MPNLRSTLPSHPTKRIGKLYVQAKDFDNLKNVVVVPKKKGRNVAHILKTDGGSE